MSEPSFLTVDQLERLHERLIDRFGGSRGLRDRLLFEGAVLHRRNVYYYARGDLFDVAAARYNPKSHSCPLRDTNRLKVKAFRL